MSMPKKKSVGRPRLKEKDRRQAIEVTLKPSTIEDLRSYGEGNVSRGIEVAANHVRQTLFGRDERKSKPSNRSESTK